MAHLTTAALALAAATSFFWVRPIGAAVPPWGPVAAVSPAQAQVWDQEIAHSGTRYNLTVSDPYYVVAHNITPPAPGVKPQLSNNCVGIFAYADGTQQRLFMGFRTAPFHFASNQTRMYIVSSVDSGATWTMDRAIDFS